MNGEVFNVCIQRIFVFVSTFVARINIIPYFFFVVRIFLCIFRILLCILCILRIIRIIRILRILRILHRILRILPLPLFLLTIYKNIIVKFPIVTPLVIGIQCAITKFAIIRRIFRRFIVVFHRHLFFIHQIIRRHNNRRIAFNHYRITCLTILLHATTRHFFEIQCNTITLFTIINLKFTLVVSRTIIHIRIHFIRINVIQGSLVFREKSRLIQVFNIIHNVDSKPVLYSQIGTIIINTVFDTVIVQCLTAQITEKIINIGCIVHICEFINRRFFAIIFRQFPCIRVLNIVFSNQESNGVQQGRIFEMDRDLHLGR